MEDHIPLIIVIATIVLLWVLGKYVSRQAQGLTIAPQAATAIPQSKMFADGLHIEEMSNVLIKELQDIITRQDEKELIYFLARYQPSFIELNQYLSDLRSQYFTLLGKPSSLASEADKINAVNEIQLESPPACIDLDAVNKTELRTLVEKNLSSVNLITTEFMDRFGGKDFMENFQVFTQLSSQQPVTMHARPDHQNRAHLETFVEHGIALQGRKIPLKERLEVLNFNQLKEMATDLKLSEEFNDKSEVAEALAQMPGSAVHLSMIYESDDIFYIEADPTDAKAIDEEWELLNAFAKLLIGSLKNTFVTFDEVAV
ncbi:hypothetical protein [Kaarinaea lacus]